MSLTLALTPQGYLVSEKSQLFATSQQISAAGVSSLGPAVFDAQGYLLDRNGNRATATQLKLGVARSQAIGIWLPFTANGTQSRLVDRSAGIVFSNSAVAGGVALATQAPVAIAITTGVVTETGHPLRNGEPVMLNISAGAAGLKSGTIYFVTGATANTYGLAAVPNGTAITTTTAGTATRYSMGRSALAGAQFNGSDYLQSSITQQAALQKAIMRLDTLKDDGSDCIVVYMELTHGLGLAGGVDAELVWWGRRNATGGGQGWGISIAAAAAQVKLQFEHCAAGSPSNALVQPISGNFALQGDGFGGGTGTGVNTRTALAISISKLPLTTYVGPSSPDQGNFGLGAGCFYIEAAKMGMTDVGYFGQQNRAVATPARMPPGSTSIASFCDAGITVGMSPGNSPTTVIKPMVAGQGIDNLILQRRKRVGGMVCQAVRQGVANYQANPFALPQQPGCLAL